MLCGSLFVNLPNGYKMPLVGFGTYRVCGREIIYEVLDEWLRVGLRSIDTAAVYKNEEDIGYALRKLLPKYNLKREDIFITTKLSPSANGDPDDIRESVTKSLQALGTSYIDLYLIHWPGAGRIPVGSVRNIELRAITWKTLVHLHKQGLLRTIGVSNYTRDHLECLLHDCDGVIPAVNQVECHPHYRQDELRTYCRDKGIHVQAYSSLGSSGSTNLLNDPTVLGVAKALQVSPARVLLRWAVQQGIGIIPKAVKKDHIRENVHLDFVIHEGFMQVLSSLPQRKYAWDPASVH